MHEIGALFHDLVRNLGYAGLFVAMALGNLGIPVGTEIIMPTAGALAGQGHLPPLLGIPAWIWAGAIGTLGELAGGAALYAIGWYGGLPFVHRFGPKVGFRVHHLTQVHQFYDRWGAVTVFWCRFLPFVRGVAALPPGLSRMPKRYFLTYTALGSAVFCFGLAYLGNAAGRNLDTILANIHRIALVALAIVVVAAIAGALYLRARAKRAASAGAPAPTVRPR